MNPLMANKNLDRGEAFSTFFVITLIFFARNVVLNNIFFILFYQLLNVFVRIWISKLVFLHLYCVFLFLFLLVIKRVYQSNYHFLAI